MPNYVFLVKYVKKPLSADVLRATSKLGVWQTENL